MKTYLDLLQKIMDGGVGVQTGAYLPSEQRKPEAVSLFGEQIEFDLADGFPAVTTKPLWWRGVVTEWLWFMTGSGRIDFLREHGVSQLWESWVKKDAEGNDTGDLGPVYGVQYRRWPVVEAVSPKQYAVQPPAQPPFFLPFFPSGRNTLGILGNTYVANDATYGKYRVVCERDETNDCGHRLFDVQFLETGYVSCGLTQQSVVEGRVKDRYAATVYGVGRLGDPAAAVTGDDEAGTRLADLRKTWSHMLERCYDHDCKEYKYYGARGVVVDGPWHVFSRFVEDVHFLEGWDLKHANPGDYQLDKDYTGGGCYSQETCVWLHKDRQKVYRTNARPFRATSPDGVTHTAISAGAFARTFDLQSSKISACLQGTRPHHRGWTFQDVPQDGLIYREREIDQIGNAIADIRAVVKDPSDRARRRIIVTLWNPPQIRAMALPPCHTFHMYYVEPGDSEFLRLARTHGVTCTPLPSDVPGERRYSTDAGTPTRLLYESFAAKVKYLYSNVVRTAGGEWLVYNQPRLHLHLFARSIDAFTGLPFNIASYALMLQVVARLTGCRPGKLKITFNDVHIYDNQFEAVRKQLRREPLPAPKFEFADTFDAACRDLTIAEAEKLQPAMFKLAGYNSHPALDRPEVAV